MDFNFFSNTLNGSRRMRDKALAWTRNQESQNSFLEECDTNHDGQLSVGELKQRFDGNQDGYLDTQELKQLALKARSADFDTTTIQSLGASLATVQTEVLLFSREADGHWRPDTALKQRQQYPASILPFSEEVLASRDMQQLAQARRGLFRVQEQVGNSCGTTALSMVMKYFQGHTLENSVPTIDRYIRARGTLDFALPTGQIKSVAIDGYTAPRDIVNYANQRGLRAGLKNQASLAELRAFLDQGVPCLCLTDWNFGENGSEPRQAAPDAQSLHWVSVIGYETRQRPGGSQSERVYLVANPHGWVRWVQRVAEADFDKVWSGSGPGLEQLITGQQRINTGMRRLLIAMVPRDEQAEIIAPDGSVRKAGTIQIPQGHDGLRGQLAQVGSRLLQQAGNLQEDLVKKGGQALSELQTGWKQDGIWGALKNLWAGDTSQVAAIRQRARSASVEQRAQIVSQLLNAGINRRPVQQLIYDILKDTSWEQFPALISQLDMNRLATRLEDDTQAGEVLAWIARSEVKQGKTGPKFDAFALCLAQQHREAALETFLNSHYTRTGQLLHKVPAAAVRLMIEKLMDGVTDSAEETAIYHLLQGTSWEQFDQVLSRLNMGAVAAEMEDSQELGHLTAWVVELGLRTGHWSSLSEILTRLETALEYTRADDVLATALQAQALQGQLGRIPAHLRQRMIDLLNDVTRLRSAAALQALAALKKA